MAFQNAKCYKKYSPRVQKSSHFGDRREGWAPGGRRSTPGRVGVEDVFRIHLCSPRPGSHKGVAGRGRVTALTRKAFTRASRRFLK
jgi:hypothetical protein